MAAVLDQRAFNETKLMKACVRSVVYHLKNDIRVLEDENYIAGQESGGFDAFVPEETEKRVKKAERQLWRSTIDMKWLLGTTVTGGKHVAWIKVREGNPIMYRWVVIDAPEHLLLIQRTLREQCERYDLNISKASMQRYEAWGAGMNGNRVWKEGKWHGASNIPERVRRDANR